MSIRSRQHYPFLLLTSLYKMRNVVMAVALLALVACDDDAEPIAPGTGAIASGTFTVAPASYANDFWYFPVDGGTQGNPAKVATIPVPAITTDILSRGAVFVYMRTRSSPTGPNEHWTLLPFQQGGFGGGYLVSIKAAVRAGEVRIGYAHENTGGTNAPNVYQAALPTYEFRWVVVEGVSSAFAAPAVLIP